MYFPLTELAAQSVVAFRTVARVLLVAFAAVQAFFMTDAFEKNKNEEY